MTTNIFDSIYKPDVLSCLADLSNDEIMTPPSVANQMLDALPKEIWRDPTIKILDPAVKSGVFLREAAKRFIEGEAKIYPDLQERVNHIFREQLYGIAITEMTSLLARRSVYCSKYPNGPFSIVSFDSPSGNIHFVKTKHTWENGRCKYCGASQSEYERDDSLESHAYEFIHTQKPEELLKMKFDVIVSNPPYQLSDGGSGTGISAKPIYQHFVQQAKKLNPKYITMIIPSRWFAGGKGLDDFRDEMLHDRRLRYIADFMSSKDCFPGVNIAGGVNYFLWDKTYDGDCIIENISSIVDSRTDTRALSEFPIFIRDNRAISIIRKFISSGDDSLANHVYTRNPFGFTSNERGVEKRSDKYSIKLISSGGTGYVSLDSIQKNKDIINKYKSSIGKIVPSNGEVDTNPLDGYKVITSNRVVYPNEVVTESYLILRAFNTEEEADRFKRFMELKFPRFMMKHTLSSMNISTQNFMFVPFLDSKIEWTDDMLYDRYNLSAEERDYVESLIRSFPKEEE